MLLGMKKQARAFSRRVEGLDRSPAYKWWIAGHECYVVGGAIRDLLLGKVPKDFDVLTTATPAQVRLLSATAMASLTSISANTALVI